MKTFQDDNRVRYPKVPQRVAQNEKLFHLALHFISSLQVIVDNSNLVCVEHSTPQPTDDKLSLKGAWSLSRDICNFWKISDNISKTVQDSLIVSMKLAAGNIAAIKHTVKTKLLIL